MKKKVDYTKPKNLCLTSVVLVTGVSGMSVTIGSVQLKGMALGTFVAILVSVTSELFEFAWKKFSNQVVADKTAT